MMQSSKLFILALSIFLLQVAFSKAQLAHPDSLFFREDSTYKIIQFTDVHWESHQHGNASTLKVMNAVLEKEKPDMVVLTGDIVLSKYKNFEELKLAWHEVTKSIIKHRIPWVVTLGNHDSEGMCCRDSVYQCFINLPYNLNQRKSACNYDFCLPVYNSDSLVSALLYFFDSNDYPTIESNSKYDCIHPNQIAQYQMTSDSYTRINGMPIPALAFFHIPIPEFRKLCDEDAEAIGHQKERVCSSEIENGLFAAMKKQGDIMGVFCGHDHNNDCIGEVEYIALAYGRRTGSNAYGNLTKGARVIVLHQNQKTFDSWISLRRKNLSYYHYSYQNNDVARKSQNKTR